VQTIPPTSANGIVNIWDARVAQVAADGADVVVIEMTPTKIAAANDARFSRLKSFHTNKAMIPPPKPIIPAEMSRKYCKSLTDFV
jgi:hypothetical protein